MQMGQYIAANGWKMERREGASFLLQPHAPTPCARINEFKSIIYLFIYRIINIIVIIIIIIIIITMMAYGRMAIIVYRVPVIINW